MQAVEGPRLQRMDRRKSSDRLLFHMFISGTLEQQFYNLLFNLMYDLIIVSYSYGFIVNNHHFGYILFQIKGWVSRIHKFWKYKKHLSILFAILPFLWCSIQLHMQNSPKELNGLNEYINSGFFQRCLYSSQLFYLGYKYLLHFVSYS